MYFKEFVSVFVKFSNNYWIFEKKLLERIVIINGLQLKNVSY